MTWVYRPDRSNPEAYGVCANSNRHYPRSSLIKQMDYRGGATPVWTGLWVHPDFADKLDTVNRQITPPPDPEGVKHPLADTIVTGEHGDNWMYSQDVNGDYYDINTGNDAAAQPQLLLWR